MGLMDPLLELLSEYELTSSAKIARTLSRFGRPRLRSLLTELAAFTPPVRAERPGEITYFPAGGKMGLGSAVRAARGLLLAADHIAFPNNLRIHAADWLSRLDDKADLDGVKSSLNTFLHPYLYQYLQIRPLIDEGLASLVNVSPPIFSLVHPMANKLRRDFLQWVEYGVDGRGQPWFVMGVGSNYYSSGAGIDSFGTMLIQARPLPSTDELIPMQGGFKPMGDGVELRDREALASGTHPLAESYEKFISVELFRVQALAEGARRTGGRLVTDSDADWRILDLLCTRDEIDLTSPDAALAEVLGDSLPFLESVSLTDIVELRLRLGAQFDAFRGSLLRASRDLAQEPDVAKRHDAARRIVLEELQPKFSAYTAMMKATARERLVGGAVGVGSIVLTMMMAFVNHDWPTAAVATGAVGVARPYIDRALSAQKERDLAGGDPMFFLWELQRKSE